MSGGRLLLAVGAIASAVACARVDRLLDQSPKPPPDIGDWSRQRERWTRSASIYDGLTMRALASATYQAPELRRTRAMRTAQWKAMAPAETQALLAEEEAELAKFDEFLVWMTTSDPDDSDLDSPRTAWRIALVSPGATDRVGPEVDEVRPDALLRTLYPEITDFDTVYRVRFARPEGVQTWSAPFTLRLAGPRGRLEFPFAGAAPAAEPALPDAISAPE